MVLIQLKLKRSVLIVVKMLLLQSMEDIMAINVNQK